VAGGWAGWLVLGHVEGVGGQLDRLEATSFDWRLLMAGELPPPRNIVVVAIDDATVHQEGRYPIDRGRLARIIDNVGASGARAVAIDMLFLEAGEAAADAALAKALAGSNAVIAQAASFPRGAARLVPRAASVLSPLPMFSQSARTGLVNLSSDRAGTPRHIPLFVLTAEGPTPSLVLQAAGLFVGSDPVLSRESVRLGETARALDLGWHLPLRFYGPSGQIKTVSATRLFDANVPELSGKLVFLGVTATAVGDSFSTPFDPGLPGVEVLATAAANLLEGTSPLRTTFVRKVDAVGALCLAVIGVLIVGLVPLPYGLLAAIGLLLVWLGFVILQFFQGVWFAAVLPVAAFVPPVALAGSIRQFQDRRVARALAESEAALRRFQPRALAVHIAANPDFLMVPEERNAAIVFIDLAGFTGMSERLGASGTRELLKEFHTLVVEEIVPRDGVVLSFMGDGAMVVFGLPEAHDGDAANAVAASFGMIETVRKWIAERGSETRLTGVRVGAHYGPVVMSRLGHDEQQHITATGDSVNVASRLMEVAKEHGGASMAISEELWAAAGPLEGREPERWEVVSIRGREKAMKVALWR